MKMINRNDEQIQALSAEVRALTAQVRTLAKFRPGGNGNGRRH
jgi:hypothetical protein